MAILRIRNVSKSYGQFRALREVSFDVERGSTFGLLGPNGAGKTSLIRIINKITAPDEGELIFDEEPLRESHLPRIGYLPEERGLYPGMRVGEQLLYFARLRGMDKAVAQKEISHWLEKFDMVKWRNHRLEALSKGMAQKIQFIATVIHKPELLILDEPFTGFDPINTNLIKNEILGLKRAGASIIFSTHRMDSVEELCEDIALINKGKLILSGKLAALRQESKSHTYRCELEGDLPPNSLATAEILSARQVNGRSLLQLRAKADSGNALISELMQYGELHHFSEELPRLNDIFIQKVQES